ACAHSRAPTCAATPSNGSATATLSRAHGPSSSGRGLCGNATPSGPNGLSVPSRRSPGRPRMADAAVQLVRGDDPILRDDEVARLVDELLAGEPRLYALEDFTLTGRRRSTSAGDDGDSEPDDDAGETAPVFRQIMTALESPPFMTSRRVVVVRDI